MSITLCYTVFYGFALAGSIFIFIVLINTSLALVRLNFIDTFVRPTNDPGIIIWWLCCIRFGHKGKFKTRELIENFGKFKTLSEQKKKD